MTVNTVPAVPNIGLIPPALIPNAQLVLPHLTRKHPSIPTALGSAAVPAAPTQPECSSAPHEGEGAEPPICYCAHNLRWQVKWLTHPLGLLIQGSRTYMHLRWCCALHVRAQVRWGKSGRLGGEITAPRTPSASDFGGQNVVSCRGCCGMPRSKNLGN